MGEQAQEDFESTTANTITGDASDALDHREDEPPRTVEEAMQAMPEAKLRALRLAKLAGVHSLVWLGALAIFAALESWTILSGLAVASGLSVIAGVLAGVTTNTLIHEWFHYLGARFSGGRYRIPEKLGTFVYDWDYKANNKQQFYVMSLAGTAGSILTLILIAVSVPANTLGMTALFSGAVGGFVFGSYIEWPVLKRTYAGGDPLTELSKIDQRVLSGSFISAVVAGGATLLILAP